MQSDSTSKDQPNETTSKKLNVNAPAFEPKNSKIYSNIDSIWSQIHKTENIKSTILVPPQSQQYYNSSALSCNFPAYSAVYTPSNHIQQFKFDYAVPQNGASAIYTMSPVVMDTNCLTSRIPNTVDSKNNTDTITPSSNDQNEMSNESQISTDHSMVDRPIQTYHSMAPSLGVEVNNSLILPHNNQSPIMWPNCSQPHIALFPTYYPGPTNMYLIRQPSLNFSPYVVSQNKSASKLYIRSKTFNTGNLELDDLLNELVKRINPVDEFVFRSNNSRFFVIKSFTEDNIYQSIRHGVWCSTPAGNDTLVQAYKHVKSREKPNDETSKPHVYLFFSVNGSGYFCGVAEMTSELHPQCSSSVWNQKKWQNQFSVNWLYIKDVPNSYLRQIKLECNENRPVTNCRDATEILPLDKGIEVLRIIHNIHYDTCLLNDFNEIAKAEK